VREGEEMTSEEYENAKKELKQAKWKLAHLTGSDSFTQHMRMYISFLEGIIEKHEDCYHINKPALQNIEISIEVIK
jgi:flagellar biosynthesis chaperone FliJ